MTGEAEEGTNFYAVSLDYPDLIASDSINVEYNGTAYTLEKRSMLQGGLAYNFYGADYDPMTQEVDFTDYPFAVFSGFLTSGQIQSELITSTAGPNTIKIFGPVETITPTDDFKTAVKEASVTVVTLTPDETGVRLTITADKTLTEIMDAALRGTVVFTLSIGGYPYVGAFGGIAKDPHSSRYAVCVSIPLDMIDTRVEGESNTMRLYALSARHYPVYGDK